MVATPEGLPATARHWFLKKRPESTLIPDEHLELKTVPLFEDIPEEQLSGKVLLKITHAQVDPSQLLWLSGSPALALERLYIPQVQVGQPVMAGTVGEVMASWHPDYKVGESVFGYWVWGDYFMLDIALMEQYSNPTFKVPPGVNGGDFMAMGLTAITAYVGLTDVAKASKGNCKSLVVSAAAGAVGSTVVQLAKNVLGIEKVIAIAGTEAKCRFCTDVLKADVALNYKDPDFEKKFIEATPDYIDIYWDNVGPPVLPLAISRIAYKGKVVACGAMSGYANSTDTPAMPMSSYLTLIYQQASILGVIFMEYRSKFHEIGEELVKLLMTGSFIPFKNEVPLTVEELPKSVEMLYSGTNMGKLVIAVQV